MKPAPQLVAALWLLDRHPDCELVRSTAAHLAGAVTAPPLGRLVVDLGHDVFADVVIALGIARGWIDPP